MITILRFLWHVCRSVSPFACEDRSHWQWSDCWAMAIRDGQPELYGAILTGIAVELREELGDLAVVQLNNNPGGYVLAVRRPGFLQRSVVELMLNGHDCRIWYDHQVTVEELDKLSTLGMWDRSNLGLMSRVQRHVIVELNDPESINRIRRYVRNILTIPQVLGDKD